MIIFFAAFLCEESDAQSLPCSNEPHPLVKSKPNEGGMARDVFSTNPVRGTKTREAKVDPNNAPLQVLSKPRAVRSNSADCSEGIVKLRIQFLANGQIGKVGLVKGLTKGLNQDAITAAKKMKFESATKNGKPISVYKIVDYHFFIY